MTSKPFYKSKKFWLSVLGALLPFVNKLTGLDLPTEEIISSVGVIATGVVAQGAVDFKAYKYLKYGEGALGLAAKITKSVKKTRVKRK